MVVLVAKIKLKPEAYDTFIALAEGMLAPSQAEQGCISYEYFISQSDRTEVVFVEEWADRAALDDHFQTPHFVHFSNTVPDLFASSGIRIYAIDSYEDI